MSKFDVKWIATGLFVFGGTVVSLKLPMMAYAFPCFVLAHIILLTDFIRTHKNKALIFQNGYFLIMNIIASYIWLLK